MKEKCKKHGVIHKNGGYASCPSIPSWEEKLTDLIEEEIFLASGNKNPEHFDTDCRINDILSFARQEIEKAKEQGFTEGSEWKKSREEEIKKAFRDGQEKMREEAIKRIEKISVYEESGSGKHYSHHEKTAEIIKESIIACLQEITIEK